MSTVEKQQFGFQAEIKQLLHLLSHSLYQNRDIALRELISNASDALHKMRHIQLTDESQRDSVPLEIRLEPDTEAKVLAIIDNGIGMTQEELVANLGTIAHSGSREFLNRLGESKGDLSLIGQFGVGFYSAFMLADRVEVLTRSYTSEQGYRWESEGTGSFTIEPAEGLSRGTQIRLHLKPVVSKEEGTTETSPYLDEHHLEDVVRKYSSFVQQPIRLKDKVLNEQRPIWVEPKSQLSTDDYTKFYQHLTHQHGSTPLWHLHMSADSPLQFHAVLYCPRENFERFGFGKTEHGMHLCAKRILVQDDNRDLVPEYLRFLYGIVDSADLPLNVSRESLQDSSIIRKIQRTLTKKVLDHLLKMASEEREQFARFHHEFGSILREGVSADGENFDTIKKLLRFRSSQTLLSDKPAAAATATGEEGAPPEDASAGSGIAITSLEEYCARALTSQTQIYFCTAPEIKAIERNPHLEAFRKRGIEVLYLTDPVDEFVLRRVWEFDGKRLVSVDSADVVLPEGATGAEAEAAKAELVTEPSPGFEKLLDLFRDALGGDVEAVRESSRLTTSPCCLVNPKGRMSAQLEQVMKAAQREFELSKKILEVNRQSPLIQRLATLAEHTDQHDFIRLCARQLLDTTMLLEGVVTHPEEQAARTLQFMDELAEKRGGA